MDSKPVDTTLSDLEARAAFLSTIRLFQNLPSATVNAVAAHMYLRSVEAGAFLFIEGATADAVHLLATGRIKVVRETSEGDEVILRMVQPGEILGAAGGWGDTIYPASAVALDDVSVLRLTARDFLVLIDRFPDFALALIRELATRLREAESRIQDLQTERTERRIAHALLRLAAKMGTETEQGIVIDLSFTRQDLAELAGTTLSTASRTLSGWDKRGLVDARRKYIAILDRETLTAIAEGLEIESFRDLEVPRQ